MDPPDAPLTESIKAAIRKHYGGVCQYCGALGSIVVEHIVAQARGGPDTLGNATLSCSPCNMRKAARDLDPMFVAIAHARARDAAPKILAATESKQARARKARPSSADDRLSPDPTWVVRHTRWGGLCAKRDDPLVVFGETRTWPEGEPPGRDPESLWGRVHRPPRACRDLLIEFEVVPGEEHLRMIGVVAHAWTRFVEPAPPPTEHEIRAAERFLSRRRDIVLAEAKAFSADLRGNPHLQRPTLFRSVPGLADAP